MPRFSLPLHPDDICHHGVEGMHWGVKNGPPYPLDSSISTGMKLKELKKNTKSANLDKWGEDEDHNTLYLTGYSGSGKSTKAQEIAKKRNAEVIHLDTYLEQVGEDSFKNDSNKNFNKFLKSKGFDHNKYLKLAYSKDPEEKKKRWKMIDELGDYITDYGKKLYGKKKLIVEGVQLSDQTIYPDKSFFKDKPFMSMNTSAIKSWYRAGVRDETINAEDLTLQDAKKYINWYYNMFKNKKILERTLNLKHSAIQKEMVSYVRKTTAPG